MGKGSGSDEIDIDNFLVNKCVLFLLCNLHIFLVLLVLVPHLFQNQSTKIAI